MKEINNRIRLVLGGLEAEGYESLVVFIYIDDTYIALLNQEKGRENIEIEFSGNKKLVKAEYTIFLEAISQAKKYLLNE